MAMIIVVLVSFHGVLCGCATTLVPPAHVEHPVTAYIFDYGRHSGLVLPAHDLQETSAGSRYVEYTYGEWGWVAEHRAGPIGTGRALLIPSQGAFGHRSFSEHPEVVAVTDGLTAIHPFTVEREAARELHFRLAHKWESRSADAVLDERYGQKFVKVDDSYTLLHNCNQVLAQWARELGCEVYGWPVLSHWRIQQSPDATSNGG